MKTWQTYRRSRPERPRPIVLVGAGGIARDAHLPAYRGAGYPVASITDVDPARARALATEHGVAAAHGDVAAAVATAPADAVYDLALPPQALEEVLEQLPDGAPVLVQKPFGEDLAQARRLLAVCRRKGLVAACNLQLRWAPQVLAVRRLVDAGDLGAVHDVEVRVVVQTPWALFPSVADHPRLELTMHSVHHLDLVRSLLGEPTSVSAVSAGHPDKALSTTRTAVLLHYPGPLRAFVDTDHDHDWDGAHQEAHLSVQGTAGAVRAGLGVLLDYPRGRPDVVEVVHRDGRGWRPVPVRGSWFPDAFASSMGSLQRYVEGSSTELPTRAADAARTTALLEAAVRSALVGGVRPDTP